METKRFVNFITNRAVLFLIPMILLAISANTAYAQHDAIVTISPDIANCGELGNEFTVKVQNNNTSQDDILQVEIYKALAGISDFTCGPAPLGWNYLPWPGEDRCIYVTGLYSPDKIAPGSYLDFKFDATMSSDSCSSRFVVATVDDESLQGDRDTNNVDVVIDCSPPTIYKSVDGPQVGDCPPVPGSADVCWVMDHKTDIVAQVYDNENQCDLGLDYCTYTILLDGVKIFEHKFDPADPEPSMGWKFNFTEDSVHTVEITCVDIAGNVKTDVEVFRVDSTPPISTKWFVGPQKIEKGVEWIDGVSEVWMSSYDPDPTGYGCNIGVDTIYYIDNYFPEPKDWRMCSDPETYCKPLQYVEPVWNVYERPLVGLEESCHVVEYYAVDELGNKENNQVNCFFVDKTPPEVHKTVGTPALDETGIKLTISENGVSEWTNELSHSGNYAIHMTTPGTNDQGRAILPYDGLLSGLTSFSYWSYTTNAGTVDQLSIWVSFYLDENGDDSWDYYVQCEPYYTYGNPTLNTWEQFDVMNMKCVNYELSTGLSIDCPHSAPTLQQYIDGSAASMECPGHPEWGNFASREYGSLEVLHIDMRAGYGGPWAGFDGYIDDIDFNGEILTDIGTQDSPWWVTSNTDIVFSCEDQLPHPSGGEQLCFKVSYDYPEWGYITERYCGGDLNGEGYCCVDVSGEKKFNFNFQEDSMHNLEYYCVDAVNKMSETHVQYYKVDSTAPDTTKTYVPDAYIDSNGWEYIDTVHQIELAAKDGGDICAIGVGEIQYRVSGALSDNFCQNCENWMNMMRPNMGEWNTYEGPFGIPEESCHVIEYRSVDMLGNTEDIEWQCAFVDKSPPVIQKLYGDPYYTDGKNEWITSNTQISLNVYDPDPHPSGVADVEYRVTQVDESYCWNSCGEAEGSGDWTSYGSPFTIGEESCHLIEIAAVDNVGKKSYHRQCVFVDNTDPTAWKAVGEPKFPAPGMPDVYYISGQTPITMYCEDMGDHPVNHVSLWYRYRFSDDCDALGDEEWTGWIDPAGTVVGKTIFFPQDSCHELEYYCVDILGNEGEHLFEIDIVDSQAPVITKEMVGPWYGDCPPEECGDECYVDTATSIYINAIDPEPHPADNVLCDWWYYVNDGERQDGGYNIVPPFTVDFPEECYHNLYVECWDALGNTALDVESFIVDKSPPVIEKLYGEPYFGNDYEYITSDTPIYINVWDPAPHPSGLDYAEYRISLVEDEYCYEACGEADGYGDWMPLPEGPVYIGEDSCHLIEIYAVDNVEKESYHRQCVFVDNQGPDPVKTVGEKKAVWDGLDAYYYDLAEFCAIEGNCWRVTTTTPINLDCEDPDPHPVGHESVCFHLELDGDDYTGNYCDWYGGLMDEGYCCFKGTKEEFYFMEESEHNLDYYCVDALGNKGPHDDEKFKVHGETFEIPLYKKWNLISVPFVLMDNEADVVFEGIEENIIAVWTFDNGEWYVWTPGESPDSLETVDPGWGYWVLMDDYEKLVVGGSLLGEGPVSPPSKQLYEGWNLIGYYAATGMDNCFDGGLQILGDGPYSNWWYQNPVYCSLNSLVDTQQGFPRWSSLWAYYNDGGHGWWDGLNACCETEEYNDYYYYYDYTYTWCPNYMFAGQGYWVEMDTEDLYAPATNCIWNEDMHCVEGGLIA